METCSPGDVTGFLDGEPPPQTQSEGGSSPPSRSGSILPHPPTRRAPGSRGGRRPRRGRGSVPMGLEEDIRPHARSHHGLPLWAAELPQQPDPLAKGQCHQTGGQNAVRPGTLIPSPHPSNETGFPGGGDIGRVQRVLATSKDQRWRWTCPHLHCAAGHQHAGHRADCRPVERRVAFRLTSERARLRHQSSIVTLFRCPRANGALPS
jgi:hypothetical protein